MDKEKVIYVRVINTVTDRLSENINYTVIKQ